MHCAPHSPAATSDVTNDEQRVRNMTALWGINSDRQPLRGDLYAKHVRTALGLPDDAGATMHGFSSYAESFRRGFLKRIFYEGNGNIPKDQTLDRQYRC